MRQRVRHKAHSGMTLIEVLVAMVVLSFGMISFAGLQAVSIKAGKMAQYRTVASQIAGDYSDRMRANAIAATNGAYNFNQAYAALAAPLPIPICAVPICTAVEISLIDLAQWRNNARLALPGGSLFALIDVAAPVVTAVDFWVLWIDPSTNDAADVGQNCPPEIGNNIAGPRCMHFRYSL